MADEGVTNLQTGDFLTDQERATLELRLALKAGKPHLSWMQYLIIGCGELPNAPVEVQELVQRMIDEYHPPKESANG